MNQHDHGSEAIGGSSCPMQDTTLQLDALGAVKELARFFALKLSLAGECYCRCEPPDLKALTEALSLCYKGGFWYSVGKALGVLTIFGTGVAVGASTVVIYGLCRCPGRAQRPARGGAEAVEAPPVVPPEVARPAAVVLANLRNLALQEA